MHKLVFYLASPIIWLFSKLPFRVLYTISDAIYFLFFYLIGYRKKVVLDNLKLVYPEKSESDLKVIQKKFFMHFVDTLIEAIKAITISETSIKKRYKYKNIELIDSLHAQGKSIILVGAHYGNWEWVVGMPLLTNMDCYCSYTKIQNKKFENLIKDSRSKFGMTCLKSSEIIKGIVKNVKEKKQGLYLLISDQSPMLQKNQYWADFLNVKVPIFMGAEMISKKFDFAVVNMNTTRVKRGYYESEFELITDRPKELEEHQITNKYLRITEAHIHKAPEFYLWSHKRFKHKGKERV
ncbi:lipid A biosynthesis protein [Polaribacter pacificus]|uniref:Lipid A biosynthesis protein n=1 Tax=Polaribacter pacificus TaxID=1775173 RepID=A0A917I260_9FLAO|nr:lysophospholipid acyltransferase family protein [Polaribacter pacificus]GGH02855.1 lipid A biosynthesis protein [Polaribacter pacificus]